mmetsp:Transcript_85376/g.239079  ORF Transcript_85376/g.239079 Transcript_85376/m.239079 type:complete len:250 (-) Transcript_85376:30-779(-)
MVGAETEVTSTVNATPLAVISVATRPDKSAALVASNVFWIAATSTDTVAAPVAAPPMGAGASSGMVIVYEASTEPSANRRDCMVKRRETTRKVTLTKSFEIPASLAMESPMASLTAGSLTNSAGLLTFMPMEPLITAFGFGGIVVVPFGGTGAAVVAATVVTLAAVEEMTVPSLVVVALSESDRGAPSCMVSKWLINSLSLSTANMSSSSALASDACASHVMAATPKHLIILKITAGSWSNLAGESQRA